MEKAEKTEAEFESPWNREAIRKEREKAFDTGFAHADREALKQRILDLEVAAYPFFYVTSHLNEKSWRGTHATSKLWPSFLEGMEAETAFIFSIDRENTPTGDVPKTHKVFAEIPETDLHRYEYDEAESISIKDGEALHDSFEILSVHQQAPGAYVGCGSITMGDVRHLEQVYARALLPAKQLTSEEKDHD